MKLHRLVSFVALACVATGCAGSFDSLEPPRAPTQGAPLAVSTPEDCRKLDDASIGWGVAAVMGGGLAAASGGLTSIPGENPSLRIGLAMGTVLAGAVAAGAAYASHQKAARFTAEGCAR